MAQAHSSTQVLRYSNKSETAKAAHMAVGARMVELRGRDCPVLQQQVADAHVAPIVVL